MNKLLNNEELALARELINIGLVEAAKAFSSITGGNITVHSSGIEDSSLGTVSEYCSAKGDNVHVLVTEVKGDIEGACFLLFSEDEVENLLKSSLPPSLSEPHKRRMMADAFLMETDNIISASVITQFANLLKKALYGDVPHLHKMPESEIEKYIVNFKQERDQLLLFKTKFVADHIDMNPEFIWLMREEFISDIRELTKTDNIMDELLRLKV